MMKTYNMVATNWLAKRCLERTMASTSDCNADGRPAHTNDSSVRIITKLRATIEARVPVGNEHEAGFHYGADVTD